jgi:hypothetical protein
MAVRRGVDYSAGPPDPAKLAAAGYTFACRYLSTLGNPKNLTIEEKIGLLAHGISVVLVYETTSSRALSGHQGGVVDAQSARVQTLALGLAGAPIYFAVDFDVPDYAQSLPNTRDNARAKLGPIADYFDGVASVIGLPATGGYGGYWAIKRLFDAGLITYGWQTYAWSGGQWDLRAQIRQVQNGVPVAGVECDLDEALVASFGQTEPPAPPVKRKPAGQLRAEKGYWAWAQWRLGEGDWKGYGPANPAVRPNEPRLISAGWWVRLARFLAARR